MSIRKMIMVLGMHRSGTSAITRALNAQGAILPQNLMPPGEDNPTGFFESLPVVEFNSHLMKECGLDWDDPRPCPTGYWESHRNYWERVDRAKDLLLSEFPEGDLFVLKDPRLSRLLPIWLPAVKAAGIEATALICCRNPLEVTESLKKRNGTDFVTSQLLWLSYMIEAEHHSRNLRRAIVQFDDLLIDWRGTLASLYERLGTDALVLSGESADTNDALIQDHFRHHRATTDEVIRHQRLSPLVKAAWVAFRSEPKADDKQFDEIRIRQSDAWTALGAGWPLVQLPQVVAVEKKEAKSVMTAHKVDKTTELGERNIILHYHLFRNAGTSLNLFFKKNFEGKWHEHEGSGSGWRSEDVAELLRERLDIVVLSSHKALLPSPEIPGAKVLPVIFVRHPLDRIRSIYEFERRQVADTEGALMAKETDLSGYIRWRLHRKGDRSIRNFQSYRFAFGIPMLPGDLNLGEEERALMAFDVLPFVGIVEHFDRSLAQLESLLKPLFPSVEFMPTKANVTQKSETSITERLDLLRMDLGDDLYMELEDANRSDLSLYAKAIEHLG